MLVHDPVHAAVGGTHAPASTQLPLALQTCTSAAVPLVTHCEAPCSQTPSHLPFEGLQVCVEPHDPFGACAPSVQTQGAFPLHPACPGPHDPPQPPSRQVVPAPHAVEQFPQWFWSVASFTHDAPQIVVPTGHEDTQP